MAISANRNFLPFSSSPPNIIPARYMVAISPNGLLRPQHNIINSGLHRKFALSLRTPVALAAVVFYRGDPCYGHLPRRLV